ncbi:hypothetical protein [Lichenicoccus roseus]|uniref:Cupin domain-containing protein n=1 Tax=Lichenicoccus roseus TaxID=2683649 RepID=A0A5R9IYD2_9PROT|nr:hypothetical protein [Lichenicoccus roseus]TLU70480.1 hypothetical protein FE263_21800 [Lichenicoccus roseus]
MGGKKLLIVALAAPALFATVTTRAQDNAVHGVARVVLGAALPAAAPGQELSLRRVTFAPKASIPGEVHPGMQVVSVVSGHLGLQVLGGVALVRRVQPDGSMGPQQEVHAGPTALLLNPGDTVVEMETLVLHPFNPDSQPLVVLAASLLQIGKPQSIAIQQPVVIR